MATKIMATKRNKERIDGTGSRGTTVVTKRSGATKVVNKGVQYGENMLPLKTKEIYRTDANKNVTVKKKSFTAAGNVFGIPQRNKTVTRTKYKGM